LYTEDDCERCAKGENNLQSQILIIGESDLSEQMMRVFSSALWPEEERERDKGDRDDGTDGNINSIKSFLIFPTGSLFSRAF
jgi:hypothetical protein